MDVAEDRLGSHMIKVSDGKPRLHFSPASNDMSHFFPSQWIVPSYFLMTLSDYLQKLEFDTFDMNPNLPKEEVEAVLRATREGKIVDFIVSPWAYQMNQLIKKAGNSQMWQFNAISADETHFVRHAIALGGNRLYRLSTLEVYVKLPVLRTVARLLNFARRGKVKEECRRWEARLKEIYERHGTRQVNDAR